MNRDEYAGYDALGLAELRQRGEVSAEELVKAALDRLEAVADLNAVPVLNPSHALQRAKVASRQAPFFGVPFLLKDSGVFRAGEATTFGSPLFANAIASETSHLVEAFERAGLIVIGRTNTPDFGVSYATESSLFGVTSNPWNTARTPGGSSGGSAAAVAAGVVPMAHGGDGGGSIRIPAGWCGLVGLKPSRGLVSCGPHCGEAAGGLVAALGLTRTVRDTATLLDVASHRPLGEPYMVSTPHRTFLETSKVDPSPLRIGVLRCERDGADSVAAVEVAQRRLAALGHRVQEVNLKVDLQTFCWPLRALYAAEMTQSVRAQNQALGRPANSEADLSPAAVSYFRLGQRLSAADYVQARDQMHRVGRELGQLFGRVDVLVNATAHHGAVTHGYYAESDCDFEPTFETRTWTTTMCPLFNVAGVPALSLPLHWSSDGMPCGVHFSAKVGDDATLLALAGQLERDEPWSHRLPAASA